MDKINATTYKQLVKDNPKDKIEVIVGDDKQSDFKPQVKIQRWSNEVNFSLRAEEHPLAQVVEEEGKIKYVTPEYEVHMYDKPDAGEDGGHEFEWVLKEKPSTNVLQATIQTKGLDFFYQPALTQEEIDEGTSQPENVIGSYAVYHKTKGGMNNMAGMEYKVGKAFHVYRPKVIDANGAEIWGKLNIDEQSGLLTVIIDQNFLDNAVYPVIVDPTFGYTSIGATSSLLAEDGIRSSQSWAPASNGTIDSISIYHVANSTTESYRGVLYLNSDLSRITFGSEFTVTATQWADATVTSTAITSGIDYNISFWNISTGTLWSTFYDTLSGKNLIRDTTTYSSTDDPPATFTTATTLSNREYSIYATYTEGTTTSTSTTSTSSSTSTTSTSSSTSKTTSTSTSKTTSTSTTSTSSSTTTSTTTSTSTTVSATTSTSTTTTSTSISTTTTSTSRTTSTSTSTTSTSTSTTSSSTSITESTTTSTSTTSTSTSSSITTSTTQTVNYSLYIDTPTKGVI